MPTAARCVPEFVVYGVAKPGSRTLSRFYGDERAEDDALRDYLLSMKAQDPRAAPTLVEIPERVPDWFLQVLNDDRQICLLWTGVGKPKRSDTMRSVHDFSLGRALIQGGRTDLKDLAVVVVARPTGGARRRERGDAYVQRTIANALVRK